MRAERFQLASTWGGLLTGALFVPPAVGSAARWAVGGGAPVLLLTAGSVAVVAVQLAVFGRRPRVVEVLPGGDGLRLHALFRRWDVPGARVTAVHAMPQVYPDDGREGGVLTVDLVATVPAGSRARLPGRHRPAEPPARLQLRLSPRREPAVRDVVRRLQALDPQRAVVLGRDPDGRPASVTIPDEVLPFPLGVGGFWLLCLLLAGCAMLWIGGMVAGLEALTR